MASALYILELEIASSLRRQSVFRDRLNPLDEYSNVEFIARYRITRYIFTGLLKISSKLFRSTTHPIQLVIGKVVGAQWTKQGVSSLTVRKNVVKLLWQL